ncbi:phosphoribosylformimino-5-aminoimidazole carboxamide ribotide isomerase [Singulisphaera sp. GP187]|uniref:HisA/HisF-related TIM barrel protein n=1 Tax=Singulisphaera sp. GP187 TaxID=1882752 RepID=UPI000927B45F|nr:HisA/HisF-related TIM barrel protein [Singulisphaera sp. GP187]SIO65998.1 phosphoribosylformimino-5-aminoimidazole carboxamide ribotide isomerase [Singulisphaera sp. GP187]
MPLRVIPVLDVKDGCAVHAVGGDRAHYRPLTSVLHSDSDPVALARALHVQLRFCEVYLADLDAIAGAGPNLPLYHRLAELGLSAWVDAGVRDVSSLPPLLAAGVPTILVGLETVSGPEALRAIVETVGPEQLVFSLDLRNGTPLTAAQANWCVKEPGAIAEEALAFGVRRFLLLDLARVGLGRGIGTEPLLRHLALAGPDLEITVGGGISSGTELHSLDKAGASAVLVGSALHDGRIGSRELAQFGSEVPRGRPPGTPRSSSI